MRTTRFCIGWTIGILLAAASSFAAEPQPTPEDLAKDPVLFLSSARKVLHWDEPQEPAKVVGPIYFVGTKGIGDNYRRTFRTLEALKPNIWLAPHNEKYGFEAKLAKAAMDGPAAWVDLEGYSNFIAMQKAKFEAAAKE